MSGRWRDGQIDIVLLLWTKHHKNKRNDNKFPSFVRQITFRRSTGDLANSRRVGGSECQTQMNPEFIFRHWPNVGTNKTDQCYSV